MDGFNALLCLLVCIALLLYACRLLGKQRWQRLNQAPMRKILAAIRDESSHSLSAAELLEILKGGGFDVSASALSHMLRTLVQSKLLTEVVDQNFDNRSDEDLPMVYGLTQAGLRSIRDEQRFFRALSQTL